MPLTVKQRRVFFYRDKHGSEPAKEYFNKLKDKVGKIKIQKKVLKSSFGNFGTEGVGYRHIKNDLWELKINLGPGYRVYFKINSDQKLLILRIGTKKTQKNDIKKSLEYLGEL